MRDSYKVSDSDKYLANIFFVIGFACSSISGGVILEILKRASFTFLNFWATLFTIVLLIAGFVLMIIGWLILGEMEERNKCKK